MMTVVLKARSQTTQELGRNANYLAPLRPTDSEALRVGPGMFNQPPRRERLRELHSTTSPSQPESLSSVSRNRCEVKASCTHLSNDTQTQVFRVHSAVLDTTGTHTEVGVLPTECSP